MVNSIKKGKAAERNAGHHLAEALGLPEKSITRSQQHSGKGESSADIIGVEGLHFEVKHRKKIDLYASLDQAKRDAKNGRIPVAVLKKDYKKWVVVVEASQLKQFCELIFDAIKNSKPRKIKRTPCSH